MLWWKIAHAAMNAKIILCICFHSHTFQTACTVCINQLMFIHIYGLTIVAASAVLTMMLMKLSKWIAIHSCWWHLNLHVVPFFLSYLKILNIFFLLCLLNLGVKIKFFSKTKISNIEKLVKINWNSTDCSNYLAWSLNKNAFRLSILSSFIDKWQK